MGTVKSFPGGLQYDWEGLANVPEALKNTPTGAAVGQILEVTKVDSTGKILEVKAVDKPAGGNGDATAPDWVATKTVTGNDTVHIPEQKLTTGIWNNLQTGLQVGDTYDVTFNGEVYTCEARTDDGAVALGNNSDMTANDYPFCVLWAGGGATSGMFFKRSDISYPITLKVAGHISVIYDRMPEEYLPDCVVKSVNGVEPDSTGNVKITIPNSSQNGDDGFSPVATVEQTTDGAVITITDKDGTTTATITNGKDGKDGADGQPGKDGADGAPGEKGDKGDKGDPGQKGEQGIPGEKGEKGDVGAPGADGAKGDKGDTGATGAQGEPGKDGANGKDGTSATHSWNGTVLTITSASGTSSADLKGDKGDTGSAGKDGKTPVKGVDYYTDADKAEIINAVLAALGGSPVSGYVDADNNIVISAELADGTYTIKYENADGTYTEIGAFEVGAIGPAYTNLFDSESAELNKRWSNSSYGFSDTNGYVVSDFIPVSVSSDASNPTVLRFRGGTMTGKASIVYYNSDKALLADPNQSTAGADCGASRMEVTTDANGDYQISLGYKSGAFVSTWANAGYIRVCLEINSAATAITKNDIQNIIITIDEPITD